ASTVSFDLTASDSGTPPQSRTQRVTLEVLDVNEPPRDVFILDENVSGEAFGPLLIDDPEGSAHGFEVSDPRFEVANCVLRLKQNARLNFEVDGQIQLRVTAVDVTDPTLTTTHTFTIQTRDVNDPP